MKKTRTFKTLLILSLLIGFFGAFLLIQEIHRKAQHKNRILKEMALVIEEVQKGPPEASVYDEDGVPVQTEEEVQATTAAWKMSCLTSLVNKGWQAPKSCEFLVMSILDDKVDPNDLSFKAHRGIVLQSLLFLFAPIYFLLLRYLWLLWSRRRSAKT